MILLEVVRPFLKLLQRIDTAFLEAKFAGANETSRAMPVVRGDALNWRVKTVAMVASIAAVAKQDVGRVVVGPTRLTSLIWSVCAL